MQNPLLLQEPHSLCHLCRDGQQIVTDSGGVLVRPEVREQREVPVGDWSPPQLREEVPQVTGVHILVYDTVGNSLADESDYLHEASCLTEYRSDLFTIICTNVGYNQLQ